MKFDYKGPASLLANKAEKIDQIIKQELVLFVFFSLWEFLKIIKASKFSFQAL